MSTHGNGNGKNGNGEHHRVVPVVEEPVEEQLQVVETCSTEDFEEQREKMDSVHAWGDPEPSMETLHRSLVDIQRELKNQVVPTLDRVEILTKMLAAGLESTSKHTNQVDGDVADVMLEVKALRQDVQGLKEDVAEMKPRIAQIDTMRRDIQFLKDDVAEMKPHVTRIPVIISMLGEIIARLPDPK